MHCKYPMQNVHVSHSESTMRRMGTQLFNPRGGSPKSQKGENQKLLINYVRNTFRYEIISD